jgi:hypothetical protein
MIEGDFSYFFFFYRVERDRWRGWDGREGGDPRGGGRGTDSDVGFRARNTTARAFPGISEEIRN